MRKMIFSSLIIFSISVFAQNEKRVVLDPKIVPLTGATTQEFIPKDWKLQDEQTGDLNSDGLPDAVLQIVQDLLEKNASGEYQQRSRALLIVCKMADGKFTRAAVAPKLIQCVGCGGAFIGMNDGPGADVKIAKGVLIVSQASGSREVTDLTQRFRYNAATNKFQLIGQDIDNYDRANGASEITSTNYLTGKQIIEKRQFNQKTDKYVTLSKKVKIVPKKIVTIEQVDFER